MRVNKWIVVMSMLLLLTVAVSAQTAPPQEQSSAPAPAYGQDTNPAPAPAAPPVSGLDEPVLETLFGGRSYVQPTLYVRETADNNVANSNGNSVYSVTHVLGSLDLHRLWSHYQFDLGYAGGGAFYSSNFGSPSQIHEMRLDGQILWRTTTIHFRDNVSYLPEGSFGAGGFGGVGGFPGMGGGGLGSGFGGGGGGAFGGNTFGSLLQQPRVTNFSVIDITKLLSPRSSVTVAGGYGLTSFTDDPLAVNSRQVIGQLGYSRVLTKHDQVGANYSYLSFHFPQAGAGSINTHVIHGLFAHQVSGRMSLIFGAGPQITEIHDPLFGTFRRISASGRFSLHYRFPQASFTASYDRYNTSGSGFFRGATSDVARATISRPWGRLWTVDADGGYSRHASLASGFGLTTATSYNYSYVGGAARRPFGRHVDFSLHYQLNIQEFKSSNAQFRHIGGVTLSWHPQPLRLD